MRASHVAFVLGTVLTVGIALAACGATRAGFDSARGTDGGSSGSSGGIITPTEAGPDDAGQSFETRDPLNCEEAKTSKSYVGCEYWPTVTPNVVWSLFDFAVVVANTGMNDATITVTGPNAVNKQTTVPAGELRKIYLPWVPELKGSDADSCGISVPQDGSLVVPNGAYHLVSSTPVIVYQFNPLQYKPEGGDATDGGAKDWSSCPAKNCTQLPIACYSYSNDASLLLPTTAMTNNYRVTGYRGAPKVVIGTQVLSGGFAPTLTITASQPNTEVTATLSSVATILKSKAGKTVPGATFGKVKVVLDNPGDVLELVGDPGKDFSGSLVQSDKPVQVITALSCITVPEDSTACDHVEETVLPAETLGKHYIVAPPTGPDGTPVGHLVRMYGNVDGTKLTYTPVRPPDCPTTLSAGQVAECGVVNIPFDVVANNEFGVSTFLLGASIYANKAGMGDPSQSTVASVEQFRTKYVFLAPNDYPVQYADVTALEATDIEFDGKPLSVPFAKVGAGPYGIYRIDLTKSGKDGVHSLIAKAPVGVQVIGFGRFTSFQYPAGLNLSLIAAPPPPPN